VLARFSDPDFDYVGTGGVARAGVLVNNAERFELMERSIPSRRPRPGPDRASRASSELPRRPVRRGLVAASSPRASKWHEHPLAAAICALRRGTLPDLRHLGYFTSETVKGVVGSRREAVAVGICSFASRGKKNFPEAGKLAARAEYLRKDGQSVMLIAVDARAGFSPSPIPLKRARPAR